MEKALMIYGASTDLVSDWTILLHLLGALAIGMMVGYERSYHSHAAGMRTYALVCMASTLLTVIFGYPERWFSGLVPLVASAAPTHILQGLMTGIGFLGAGVIMKDGLTVRGLSSAASLWITAAIGIAIGLGFFGPALTAALLTTFVMSAFRRLETLLPHQTEIHLLLYYPRDQTPTLSHLKAQMIQHHLMVTNWSYRQDQSSDIVEFTLTLRGHKHNADENLLKVLTHNQTCLHFTLSPTRI